MHPLLAARMAQQNGVFTHAQAEAAGYSQLEIKRMVAAGRWIRLRRGVLTSVAQLARSEGEPRARHLLQCAAVLATTGRAAWISHRSAAALWNLPLIGRTPTDVAVTVAHQHRRRSAGIEFHTAATPDRHRARVDGVPITSVARTLSDLARSLPFRDALVAADAALRDRSCSSDDLAAVITDCPVWPGIARTKRVAAFADRRSESPGESLSRVAIAAAGLPSPDLQVELLLGGRRVRVDFMWPALGVVGEFDGRIKYGRGEDVWQEKLREDLIRRHGHSVARWTWRDVHPDPAPMLEIVREALRGGTR